ncbi:MAG: DoxX family protein [Cyclobacteriaceae bacterium]|jgi:putative oxidoreductase|nr:DoxX family protein [Cyclobacteriaceae bacterium]
MKKFFDPTPILPDKILGAIRILLGLLTVYHGLEVFQAELMNEYASWTPFQGSYGNLMVYMGKSTELLAGLLLTAGAFTRIGALLLIGALSYITFFVGQGRFWYEDQHPFMFVLLGVIYLFYGPGAWSVDGWLAKKH